MAALNLSLLTKRRFAPLFVVQFLGAFNDNVLRFAMIFLASFTLFRDHPEKSAQLGTIAAGLFMLPYFCFSSLAGQLADGMDKARLVRWIKATEIIIMSLSLIGFWTHSVTALLIALFFMGLHSTFFGPVKYAIIPQHLGAPEILGGTALIEAGTFIAILAGQLLGSTVTPMFAGVIATCLSLTGFITSLFIPPAPPERAHIRIELNIFKSTWAGMRRAWQDNQIWLAILGISWFFAAGAVLLSEFAPLVNGTLHADKSIATLFLLVFSVSIAVGSMTINWLLKGNISTRYVPLSAYFMGAFFILFWFSTTHFKLLEEGGGIATFIASSGSWLILFALFGIAFSGGMFIVPLYAILQTHSESGACAQTIATNNIFNAITAVALVALSTFQLTWGFSVPQLIGALGVETIIGALVAYCTTFVTFGADTRP